MRDTMGQAAALTGGYAAATRRASASGSTTATSEPRRGAAGAVRHGVAALQRGGRRAENGVGAASGARRSRRESEREAAEREAAAQKSAETARRGNYDRLYKLIYNSGYNPNETELSDSGMTGEQAAAALCGVPPPEQDRHVGIRIPTARHEFGHEEDKEAEALYRPEIDASRLPGQKPRRDDVSGLDSGLVFSLLAITKDPERKRKSTLEIGFLPPFTQREPKGRPLPPPRINICKFFLQNFQITLLKNLKVLLYTLYLLMYIPRRFDMIVLIFALIALAIALVYAFGFSAVRAGRYMEAATDVPRRFVAINVLYLLVMWLIEAGGGRAARDSEICRVAGVSICGFILGHCWTRVHTEGLEKRRRTAASCSCATTGRASTRWRRCGRGL